MHSLPTLQMLSMAIQLKSPIENKTLLEAAVAMHHVRK